MKTAITILIPLALLLLSSFTALAQCPPAAAGYHRVQKGETLYRISRQYKISVDQICRWNSIQKNTILAVCQELMVEANSPTRPTKTPLNNLNKQQGGTHRIKQGETIPGLAELYGYTEERFRAINGLRASEPAWPGLVLRTSDCNCTDPNFDDSPIYVETNGTTINKDGNTADPAENKFDPSSNIPTWEEAIADNENVESSWDEDPFGEDPFGENKSTITNYNKPTDKKTTKPLAYNKEVRKIRAPGSRNNNNTDAQVKLKEEVRRSEQGENAPSRTYLSPEEEVIRRNRKIAPSSPPSNDRANTSSNKASNSTGSPAVSKDAARYMKADEIEMVNEINRVRTNPKGYIQYIRAYRQKIAEGKGFGSVETCDELIAELQRMAPVPSLSPIECLYNAAKKHGLDQQPTGSSDHVGTDGSYPWDRVRKECTNLSDGNENLVGGPASVRESVILLLVDHGISNRGHRRTLLQKDWKYVACYKIGQVGKMPNSWVQKFGK